LARFDFVAVVARAVEEAVPRFDGVVDLVGAGVVVDFPEAEADEGHVVAAIQLDAGDGGGGVGSHLNGYVECLEGNLGFLKP
jgi:hypothetical protein